ncbi:MAG: hypothetical protein ACR2FH_01130 [Caulobacteraceae bacterium]
MAQTSFQLDEGTATAIADLKGVFGVTTSTAVIRRAVALARVASRTASPEDKTITLTDPKWETVKAFLAS